MFKNKVIIIAEAGVNHNGSISRAKKLIDVFSKSGADYIKFQTFTAKSLVAKNAKKADYQKKVTKERESHFQMLKKLELKYDDHKILINHCKKKKIKFLSSPFDIESVNLLFKLKIPFFKIPSGEITNLPYLRLVGSLGKPVVLSTGMSTMREIKDALGLLIKSGLDKKKITILHCNTEYPTPMKDVNLNAMLTIKNELNVKVGYSDHTLGTEVPIAAVALGAEIIEKHVTLDSTLSGPDHAASLEPENFISMVKAIRNIEKAIGDGVKKPSVSEMKNISVVRKSIVANKNIEKGELLTEKNLSVIRTTKGISPMKWDKIVGSVAEKKYKKNDLIFE